MAYIDHIRDTQDNNIDLYSKILANNLAEPWSTQKAYQAGDYVIQHPYLYKSKIDQQRSDTFVSSRWERKTVIEAIYDIIDRILYS